MREIARERERIDSFKLIEIGKKSDGCDFGWEENRMDVVKSGGITQIDDMAWEKKFLDGFF
jgi:hypothetical protein